MSKTLTVQDLPSGPPACPGLVGGAGSFGRRAAIVGGAGLVWALAGSWTSQGQARQARLGLRPESAAAIDVGGADGEAPVRLQDPAGPDEPVAAPARPAPLRFVRRRDWADREPAGNHRSLGRVDRITIHHTGADTLGMGVADRVTVRRIEDYHRDERGWSCIGYHFLVGDDGTVYEGRPLALQGAHVRDHNEHNVGIACIGKFDVQLPSAAQLASLERLVAAVCGRTGLDEAAVLGHRDLSPSTCPGDAFHAWLQRRYHGPAFG